MKDYKTFLIAVFSFFIGIQPVQASHTDICKLTDDATYKSIVVQVRELNQKISTLAHCQQDINQTGLYKTADTLEKAIEKLAPYLDNLENLEVGNVEEFDKDIQTAFGSLTQIGNTLKTLSRSSSEACGKQIRDAGDLLLAVSDVATVIGPLAMVASAFGATAVLGPLAGVAIVGGNAIKFIDEILKSEIDIKNESHRQVVLNHMCEYTKARRRLVYLRLNPTGSSQEIIERKRELEEQLKKQRTRRYDFSPSIEQAIETVENYEEYNSLIQFYQVQFKDIQEAIISNPLPHSQCRMARELAKGNLTLNTPPLAIFGMEFPGNILTMLDNLSAQGVFEAPLSLNLDVMEYKDLENFLLDPNQETEACSEVSAPYVAAIGSILSRASETFSTNSTLIQNHLLEVEEYSNWVKETAAIKSEIMELKGLESVLDLLGENEAVVYASELQELLKQAEAWLFHSPGFGWADSPTQKWLNYKLGSHASELRQFHRSYQQLIKDTSSAGRSTPSIGREGLLTLKLINTDNYPPQSQEHRLMCARLQNTRLAWVAAVDHLTAAHSVCHGISDLVVQENIQDDIQKVCITKTRLNSSGKSVVVEESRIDLDIRAMTGLHHTIDPKLQREILKNLNNPQIIETPRFKELLDAPLYKAAVISNRFEELGCQEYYEYGLEILLDPEKPTKNKKDRRSSKGPGIDLPIRGR